MQPFSEFPAIEIEPTSDFCLVNHQRQGGDILLLAYAVKRDFLSVPKTFCISAFSADPGYNVEYHCLDKIDYLEQLELAQESVEPGWLELESTENESILLLLTERQAIEIACDNYQVEQAQYHSESALQAILSFIANND
ncbi:hypothetical protein [Aliikangiella sp. IMCC44632]